MHSSTITTSIIIMPSIPKTSRREHSSEMITAISKLHKAGKSLAQIGDLLSLPRSTAATILDQLLQPSKRSGRPLKLDDRDRRTLIRQVQQFSHNNLKALSTPLKSGYTLSKPTIRKYLKSKGFFRFKARKKLYLIL